MVTHKVSSLKITCKIGTGEWKQFLLVDDKLVCLNIEGQC